MSKTYKGAASYETEIKPLEKENNDELTYIYKYLYYNRTKKH